jgi:predicted transcriptional regulator
MVQLSDELLTELDREAARQGASRSSVIRDAITTFLEQTREADVSRAIVDGYRRIPQGTLDDWGDLAALADENTSDMLERLNVEEQAQGLPPW